MQRVLESLVIDTESDHNTQDTARRVARMYLTEVFRGRYTPIPPVTEFPNVERLNELMIVGPITVRSACSHHLCPIIGKVWIGVMPNEHSNLIGLSKYARLCDWVMSRPQIQEEAVTRLADLLQERMQPDGLAVVMEADHFCMQWRGVKDTDSKMINSVMRGSFLKDAEPAPRIPRPAAEKERLGGPDARPTSLRQPLGQTRGSRGDRVDPRAVAQAQPGTRHHRHPVPERRHLHAGARGRARRP